MAMQIIRVRLAPPAKSLLYVGSLLICFEYCATLAPGSLCVRASSVESRQLEVEIELCTTLHHLQNRNTRFFREHKEIQVFLLMMELNSMGHDFVPYKVIMCILNC